MTEHANIHMHECQEVCINCGNDIGPHHLCTECLENLSTGEET